MPRPTGAAPPGGEVRRDRQKADPGGKRRQRGAREAARVRLVGIERAEDSRNRARRRRAATSARPFSAASVEAGLAQGLPTAKRLIPASRLGCHWVGALLPREQREERLAVHEQDAVATLPCTCAGAGGRRERELRRAPSRARPRRPRSRRGTSSRRRGRAARPRGRSPSARRRPRAQARLPAGPHCSVRSTVRSVVQAIEAAYDDTRACAVPMMANRRAAAWRSSPASRPAETRRRDTRAGRRDRRQRGARRRASTASEDSPTRESGDPRPSPARWSGPSATMAGMARLLVLGAGPAQLGVLAAARAADLTVVAADRDPRRPASATPTAARSSRSRTSRRSSGSRAPSRSTA